jgi:hypothetical protein
MDIQERVQLLSALDVGILAPLQSTAMSRSVVGIPEPIKGTGECGLIVGSALHGCIDGLTVDNKYAVVNSQLLAERAASAKFDNESQPKEWFKRYLEVLRICGWATQGSEFTTYSASERTETVEQVTLSIINSLGGTNRVAYRRVIANSFAALRANTKVSTRFHQNSTESGSAKFRVLPCMQTHDDHVVMVLTSMQSKRKTAHSQAQVPGRFWEMNVEQTDIRYAAAECMLNMQVYNGAKAQIEKKLAGNTASFIDALDLG